MEKINSLTLKRFFSLNFFRLAVFLFATFFSWGIGAHASAANLYFSPSSVSASVGDTATVTIYVSSDQAINGVSGVVAFPVDKLEVVSLSKSGSIISFWVQEPSFSNSAGTINLGGIILASEFTGQSGKILIVKFKVKNTGATSLRFSSGEILANDGKGTNILQSLGTAQVNAVPVTVSPLATESGTEVNKAAVVGSPASESVTVVKAETPLVPKAGPPLAPPVSSSTHPDSNEWYNNKNPQFSWTLPAGITGVSIYFSQSPTSNPGPVSDGLLTSKSYENVKDGVWYFHLKFKNSYGWGPISHFKIKIDTVSPTAFTIKFPHPESVRDPRPVVLFDTTDELSGIDYYEVKVGDGQAFQVTPGEIVASNPYVLPTQKPGQHDIVVKAIDQAGNSAVASEIFTVASIDAPVLDYYPDELREGDILKVSGRAYPEVSVMIFIRDESGSIFSDKVTSDSTGNFTLIWSKKLPVGTYGLWAQITDTAGAKSAITTPSSFVVKQVFLDKLVNLILNYLSVFTLLAFFILSLIFFAWHSWHKLLLLRRKIKKEVKGVEKDFLNIFDHLQQDIEQQIKLIEKAKNKRELTKEEKRIVTILRRDLVAAKKFLSEEMENISDKV